ncbi:MAG: SpoIID/LytB domain-containing protein [Phycisphaerales bacterium]|nr:SpoIID/LytB domain-containing protein [Phycisphaerales bacterium]
MADFPSRIRQRLPLADLASAAVWASLGAALVIHGCAPDSVAKDPTAPRRAQPSTPVAVTPAAPAVPAVPAVVVAPVVPVFEQRPSVPSTEPDLRIRVAALRSASPLVRLTNPSGKLMMQGAGLAPRAVRTPIDVRQSASGWRVVELAGSKRAASLEVALSGPIEFHPPAGVHGVVAFDGTDWPGPLRLVPVADEPGVPGAIDVVIDVPLERYLPGVLAKELLRSWDLEAFKAQAIAARSFAICEHAHWSSVRHYDLIAGEASQAWVGVTKDPKPREAVQATRGMVLSFEGRVVPCYYSSTCGGTPANAAESLTRNPNHGIAPLAAGATAATAHRDCCADAPRFRWQQSFANAVICERIRRWATDQREAQAEREAQVVRVAQVERDGRMQSARAVAPVDGAALGKNASPLKGTVIPITASASVSVAAAQALKVESVTSEPSVGTRVSTPTSRSSAAGATGAPAAVGGPVTPVQPAAQVPARNGIVDIADDAPLSELAALQSIRSIDIMSVNAANRPTRLAIHDSTGRVLQLRAEDFRRAVNYAREGEPTPKDRLNSSHLLKVTVNGKEIQFVGQGFGHGVGMCQYGAQSMARSGANALLILRTYYPGAAVVRAY